MATSIMSAGLSALESLGTHPTTARPRTSAEFPPISPETLTPTGQPGVYTSSDGTQVIKRDEVLTASDKTLISALNGGRLDGGSSSVSNLKTDLALGRANGTLKGDVTPSYITGLMQQEKETSALNGQQASLYAQERSTRAAQAYASSTDPISMDVLQNALNFLHSGSSINIRG